jgi:hypothetical protein
LNVSIYQSCLDTYIYKELVVGEKAKENWINLVTWNTQNSF